MKKLFTVILASTMVLGCLSTTTTSFAQEVALEDIQTATLSSPLSDFTIKNGVLLGYTGEGGDVVIPDSVTAIGEEAFAQCTSLISVTMGNSVTTIGKGAFWECINLTSCTFTDSVLEIGEGALACCYALRSVTIPNSVVTIGKLAFGECTNLTTVTMPDSLTEICLGTFWKCESLSAVTIPDTVATLGKAAFGHCSSLTTVYYGGSEADMSAIELDNGGNWNDPLLEATWMYHGEMADPKTTPDPEATSDSDPADIASPITFDDWAESFVIFSDENHLTVDSLGTNYTNAITRLQIADLLVNMVEQYTGETLEAREEAFPDSDNEQILKAAESGIVVGGSDGNFSPSATATRQEMAIMILNSIKLMEEISDTSLVDHSLTTVSGFSDLESSWAKEALSILVNAGIMSGFNEKINPIGNTSIQEALVMNNGLFQLT